MKYINHFINISYKYNLSFNKLYFSNTSNIINISNIINKSATHIPCIYLLKLGTVKDLRISFNINTLYDDTMILLKYGCTKNLNTRLKQHNKIFNKIQENINIELIRFSIIDPLYIFNAETKLKSLITPYHYTFETFKELIIIDSKTLKTIEEQYNILGTLYSGYNRDEINNNRALLEQYNLLNEKYNLLTKKLDLLQQISVLEKQNLEQKLEILQLKYRQCLHQM